MHAERAPATAGLVSAAAALPRAAPPRSGTRAVAAARAVDAPPAHRAGRVGASAATARVTPRERSIGRLGIVPIVAGAGSPPGRGSAA